jgi:hypothetical protein
MKGKEERRSIKREREEGKGREKKNKTWERRRKSKRGEE